MCLINKIRGLTITSFSLAGNSNSISKPAQNKTDTVYQFALVVIASLLLFICSRNSPAFVYQEWVDPNIYMDVGRAVRNGAVLYRDVFDHKGPLLHLVLAVLSSFPPFYFSMTGLYLLQCVTLSISLSYLYRTARLFLKPISSMGICLGFLFFLLNNLTYGKGGGSVEELLLPLFMGTTYELIRFWGPQLFVDSVAKSPDAQQNSSSGVDEIAERRVPAFFRLGLFVGIAVLVKINLALFPAAVTMFLLAAFFASTGIKRLGTALFRIVAGVLVAATPCVLYFGATNSYSDFWQVYVSFNLIYAGQLGNTASSSTFASATMTILYLNVAAVICLVVGAICFFLNHGKTTRLGQVGLVLGFVVLSVSVFVTSRPYPFYFIPLLAYAGLAEIAIVLTVQHLLLRKRRRNRLFRAPASILYTFWLIAILIIAITNGAWSDTRWVHTEKTQTERIADVIIEKWQPEHPGTSPSILLFYSGDIGFYQLTRCVPALRYFYAPMIDYSVYPDIIDAQIGYVRDGLPDYVLFLWHDDTLSIDISKINPEYVLVDWKDSEFVPTYYAGLYEKQSSE